MLEEISISNLGIIDKAVLPFTPGLTAITGETGAGKTMVLSALHLLLGRRANSSMVKDSSKPLSVEGVWNIEQQRMKEIIEETGGVFEDSQVFINRTVKNDGKSRAVVGGKTTPASVLASIGEELVNIHGQSDQVRLKNNSAQRESLDKYAGDSIQKLHKEYLEYYRQWKKLKQRIDDIEKNSASRKREINSLRKFIEDYDKVDPQENEDQELTEKIDALSNVDTIRQGMVQAYSLMNPDNEDIQGLSSLIQDISRKISSISEYDKTIRGIEDKVSALIADADEINSEIEAYIDSLDEDSIETLYISQERELEIKALVRKYGSSLEEIREHRVSAEKELSELEEDDQPIEALKENLEELFKETSKKADELTIERRNCANKMQEEVNDELKGLSMGGSSFNVFMKTTPFSSSGQDEIDFRLKAKGNKESLPVAKSASGGELSRIMLALEVVLADTENTGTFVFDEIDSGVGGKTAIEIGKRLAKLSQEAQVIVVTHLPQVAAYADNYLKVVKNELEDSINTSVEQLSEKGIVDELTRMLSGMSDSESGKSHAKEMLQHAREFKKQC